MLKIAQISQDKLYESYHEIVGDSDTMWIEKM